MKHRSAVFLLAMVVARPRVDTRVPNATGKPGRI